MSVNGLKTIPLAERLPAYGYPINRSMISLDDAKIMTTLSLSGIPFESESNNTLMPAFELIKNLLSSLARKYGSQLAVWTHIIKRKEHFEATYCFDSNFMQRFSDRYLQDFSGEEFFSIHYYITFVFHYDGTLAEGEDELSDILKTASGALKRFSCKVLEVTNDHRCEHVEFLSYLLNYND
ncbi:hypothetical protein [Vibrio hepatarius]|uniref:hypothetical protein n=1 Tax=Vibrio hepatarius TaxID=171383 RepID=UPI0020CA9219|nr:hypothetical protein [Vibrio hepatarius]